MTQVSSGTSMRSIFYVIVSRLVGICVGAFLGIFFGSGTGIVGAFGGVAGVTIFATLGGICGFFAVPDVVRAFEGLGRLWKKVRKR